jgi:hypothetical protein
VEEDPGSSVRRIAAAEGIGFLLVCRVLHEQGPDFDDMSSFFPCIICGSFKYINPGYELLVTKM